MKTHEEIKTEITSRALAILLQRINLSKRNAPVLSSLLEQLECDHDLSAAEKKSIVGKINRCFLLSTDDLLKITAALQAAESKKILPDQIQVVLADEVEKWAT